MNKFVDFTLYYVVLPLVTGFIYLAGFGALTLASHLIEGSNAPF